MGIVLRKSAHAQQSMHHPRTFVAVDSPQFPEPHRQIPKLGAELGDAKREIAVAVHVVAINHEMVRTIHRLEPVFRVIKLHDVEHILRVIAFVP